jgi:TolB protein
VVQGFSDAPTDTPTATVPTTDTPVPEDTPASTDTPTLAATATLTPTVVVAQPQGLSTASLVGTIAYPVFNGNNYDLYFGQADGSGSQIFRRQASQPAFSPDGSQIALHSWQLDAWGLMTMPVAGGQPSLVANFVEDQLPTWSSDGREIYFLSRREGDRKSRLLKVGSTQVNSLGVVLGEGEYPSMGATGQLAFRGWGSTGSGIRISANPLSTFQPITDSDDDTAPALSPEGQKIAFMSRRSGNWEIYLVNADGSEAQRLTDDPAEDGLPTWSPDGRAIAFVSNRGGDWGIWAMTPTGEDQQLLFSLEGSPDGRVGNDTNASRGWLEERISWTR